MLIWFLYINRAEYCDAPGASFRNLVQKRTKDYANRYYRESFYHTTNYMISVKTHVLLKCSYPKTSRIVSNGLTVLPDDHRCENRVFPSEENSKPTISAQCVRSYFQGILNQVFVSQARAESATFPCIDVQSNIPIYFSPSYQQESVWDYTRESTSSAIL